MVMGLPGVRLVLSLPDATWTRDMDLDIAPFPGLGIRIDAYEILNVVAVRVAGSGDRVTCFVEFEDTAPDQITPARAESFGFTPRDIAGESAGTGSNPDPVLPAVLVSYAADRMWSKEVSLPFAPFTGLQIDLDAYVLTVFSVVIKDRNGNVTCLASFKEEDAAQLTEGECLALGFEECVYP